MAFAPCQGRPCATTTHGPAPARGADRVAPARGRRAVRPSSRRPSASSSFCCSPSRASMLFYAYLTLENGVTEATRFAVTGQQETDPSNPTSPFSREDSIKHIMRNSTPGLTIADSEFAFYDVTHRRSGTGGPSDVIQVTVTHPWQLISPMLWPFVGNGGVISLRVSATMKNEPYPTA